MKSVTILGSTGSIGLSTLDVLSLHPEKFKVYALTANQSVETMLQQCLQFQPEIAVMLDAKAADKLAEALRKEGCNTVVKSDAQSLEDVSSSSRTDIVVAAIVGAAGLLPTLAAAKAGKRILLANKEALVMSGALFMKTVAENGATLLPVDSEHNAIWQCLPVANTQHHDFSGKGVRKIILTASGGPFRDYELDKLEEVTPEQAVAHPNWSMGRKISVDSATLMNKGLELIEACWLFDATPEQIQVVVHPQSVIHSMAAYNDGSVIAQLGNPDMRTPIAYGLAWPERIDAGVETLDLFQVARLDFEAPDETRFPCLRLAREAMQAGGAAPAVLNAANEVAVEAFLAGNIAFGAIPDVVAKVMALPYPGQADSLERVLAADRWAREQAAHTIRQLTA
nr:1-deoxy-D-xylulose-5-phosphate reductoisomerase [uncultured Halomonas sp.]